MHNLALVIDTNPLELLLINNCFLVDFTQKNFVLKSLFYIQDLVFLKTNVKELLIARTFFISDDE